MGVQSGKNGREVHLFQCPTHKLKILRSSARGDVDDANEGPVRRIQALLRKQIRGEGEAAQFIGRQAWASLPAPGDLNHG
jgi:hypothetical protein